MEKIFVNENCTIVYNSLSIEDGLEILCNMDIDGLAGDKSTKQSMMFVKESVEMSKKFVVSAILDDVKLTKEELFADFDNTPHVMAFATKLITALVPSKEKKIL